MQGVTFLVVPPKDGFVLKFLILITLNVHNLNSIRCNKKICAMFFLCAITKILAPCTSNNIRPTAPMKKNLKMVMHATKVGMLFIFNVTSVSLT
jgi:hypothetical protein